MFFIKVGIFKLIRLKIYLGKEEIYIHFHKETLCSFMFFNGLSFHTEKRINLWINVHQF